MIKKKFAEGKDARDIIKDVSIMVERILGNTLGPAGRNYFIPTGITNDGKTILENIRDKDENKDQALLAFHEVARQTEKDAGDGTTTSVVIAAQLTQDLIEKIPDIDTPMPNQKPVVELFKDLDTEKNRALELLSQEVEEVKSLARLKQVAMTSVEHPEAAEIIAKAMWECGKDGYPIIESGFNGKIETDVIEGVRYPITVAHSSMLQGRKLVEYIDPIVLVIKHAFENYSEITPFFQDLLKSKVIQDGQPPRPVVILAQSFSVPFVAIASEVVRKSHVPIILLTARFGDDIYEDVASYLNAQFIDTQPRTGRKLGNIAFKDSGTCKKVIATTKEVTFIQGAGATTVVSDKDNMTTRLGKRVGDLKAQYDIEKDEKSRDELDKRVAALTGGITTIFVDAKTTAERYYLKLKVEDAMNSCRAALNDGIVRGGGATLRSIAKSLGEDSLMYNALMRPSERIVANNLGIELDLKDVYDAYAVAKASIENPVSVVKVLLTIEGIISDCDPSPIDELVEKLRA